MANNMSLTLILILLIPETQLDSLWLGKEGKTRGSLVNSSYTYRDLGESGGLSSSVQSNTSRSNSLREADSTYGDNVQRPKSRRNKFREKSSSLKNRNSFRYIGGEVFQFQIQPLALQLFRNISVARIDENHQPISTISLRLPEDTDRLKSSEGTFRVHKIFGDGNCMYRSVSYIIWGDEQEHRSLRTMVVEHIRNNWWDYSAFVMAEWNISNKEEYYDYMIANGTYATELECVVATKLYRMNLSIYREIDETRNLERIFHNRVNRNYHTARLLFSGRTDSGHYDVLIPD